MNDALTDRVERLLANYESLRSKVFELEQQLTQRTAERDELRLKLHTAHARVTTLLERLPAPATTLEVS